MANLIKKKFKTLKSAEKYQSKLYDQWSNVTLLESPKNTESGVYTWEVSTECKEHYADNQGLCHNCGMVLNTDWHNHYLGN